VEKVLGERQILVVSCHGWRHQRLLESLDPELRERLEPVSLLSLRSGSGPDPSVATGEDRR
jgi:hypothetical protein